MGTERWVLVQRVRKSLRAPHRDSSLRSPFPMRTSSGVSDMSSLEIVDLAFRTRAWISRAEQWRRERVSLVQSRQLPVRLEAGPFLCVHIHSAEPRDLIFHDPRLPREFIKKMRLESTDFETRLNFEGLLVGFPADGWSEGKFATLQLFNDSSLEYIKASITRQHRIERFAILDLLELESVLKFLVEGAQEEATGLGLRSPVAVMLTLLGVKNVRPHYVEPRTSGQTFAVQTFDRDTYLFPACVIEDWSQDVTHALTSVFLRLWQAAGLLRPTTPFK